MDENVKNLLLALTNLSEALDEHDTARDSYDGYSWDYYGSDLVKKLKIVKKSL